MSRFIRIALTVGAVAAVVFCVEVLPKMLAERAARQAVDEATPGIVKQQVNQSIQGVARDQIKELASKQIPVSPQTLPVTEPVHQ